MKAFFSNLLSAFNKDKASIHRPHTEACGVGETIYACRISIEGTEKLAFDPVSSSSACALLPDTLIVEPGTYQIENHICELSGPGVYIIVMAPSANVIRVVLSQDHINNALLLAHLAARGNRDDGKPLAILQDLACSGFLAMTCGYLSDFVTALLAEQGAKIRRVSTTTLEADNGFNDGHEFIEIYCRQSSAWIAVDVDKKCTFAGNEGRLSALQLCNRFRDKQPVTLQGSDAHIPLVDWFGFNDTQTGFSYQLMEYVTYATVSGYLDYLQRSCQCVMIREEGARFAMSEKNLDVTKNRFRDVNWLSPESFEARYY